MTHQIAYRPISDQDVEFLQRVYASTRQDELAVTSWTDLEKESFLRMQFNAQHTHYQRHFPDVSFDLILINGEPGGRHYLHRRDDEHRIVIKTRIEIANLGWGSATKSRYGHWDACTFDT